ncbi:sensor histidine kinase [Olivibacter sitiensis]|uniref:sensor histidine kinase n=1 Tax=Olivibacter sitiensis TaxID=376470 RepID=UPI00040119B3|nr:sensor histidine kinase [Olivibacter sitiensis]
MKNLVHKIRQNRYFLLFILLFAYAQSIYIRISVRGVVNPYIFTPEAAIATLVSVGVLFLVIVFFIKHWQKSTVFSAKKMLKIFALSLMVYILIMQISGLAIAWAFGNVERNFNRETFVLSTFSDLLNGFIYGSFFLVYYYYNKNKKHQEQLATYHQALSESRITQLKTQLNPHFLFNNLNVLDQLIEEDKYKASDFLNEFADIYRYVLQVSDKELVSISEELDFANQYFKLIQHKYGNAYQLNIENKNANGFIVPLTLQLLIENAVQHNLGTVENPVCIHVNIDGNICVYNNVNLKRNSKATSGRALNNLKEQYRLLSQNPIEIQQSENAFSITIPLIHTSWK